MTETQTKQRIGKSQFGLWQASSGLKLIQLLAQQVATTALDLVFPPHCVNCERVGSFLCARCIATVTPAVPRSIPGIDAVRVAVTYSGAVIAAIHAFKYDGQVQLVNVLGDWLCAVVSDVMTDTDLVVAVPLHAQRLRTRGYNQSALLARHVAREYDRPFVDGALTRVRETSSQVNLTAHERRENVAGAFAAYPVDVAGCQVLLIDDVLTTGATLAACADALCDAGAGRVIGAAVASPVLSD